MKSFFRRFRRLPTAAQIGWMLPVVALGGGLVWFLWDIGERIHFGGQRADWVDRAIASDQPQRESRYCRRTFGYNPEYQPCWAAEREGYTLFTKSWALAQHVGELREQMVRCVSESRHEVGMNWANASHCSEAYALTPEAMQPSN